MASRLGGQQISALLESLPGIASVLRSPVADSIVAMIRSGAGLADFREADAKELVQYAVRRGLLGAQEGEELLADVKEAQKQKRASARAGKMKSAKKKPAAKPVGQASPRVKKAATKPAAKSAKKTTKKVAPKTVAKKTTPAKTTAKRKTTKRGK